MKQTILLGALATAVLISFSGFATNGSPDEKEKDKTKRGWLGVSVQDVSRSLVEEKNLKTEDGAYVVEVSDESPADSIGLKKGDIIVEFGGRRIYDSDDLAKTVSRTEPGTRSNLVVIRGGERKTFTVAVGKLPRRRSFAWAMGDGPRFRMFHDGGFLGMSTLTLNEQLAKYFGAPNDEGVLVEMVKKDSPAEKAGIMAGDVLLRVGKRSVDEIDDLWKALENYDEGDKVEIEVLRKGSKKTFNVEVEESDGPWGLTAPMVPGEPNIHIFRDGDMDMDFDIKVEPELHRLERKIKTMGPRLEDRIQQKIRRIVRSVTI